MNELKRACINLIIDDALSSDSSSNLKQMIASMMIEGGSPSLKKMPINSLKNEVYDRWEYSFSKDELDAFSDIESDLFDKWILNKAKTVKNWAGKL
jgi:hypothetical protein